MAEIFYGLQDFVTNDKTKTTAPVTEKNDRGNISEIDSEIDSEMGEGYKRGYSHIRRKGKHKERRWGRVLTVPVLAVVMVVFISLPFVLSSFYLGEKNGDLANGGVSLKRKIFGAYDNATKYTVPTPSGDNFSGVRSRGKAIRITNANNAGGAGDLDLMLYQSEETSTGETTTAATTLSDTATTATEENADTDTDATAQTTVAETKTDEENAVVISKNISDEREDIAAFSSKDKSVIEKNFSVSVVSGASSGMFIGALKDNKIGMIKNQTKISNETVLSEAEKKSEIVLKKNTGEDEPQILIMHTHTTESFCPSDDRSSDNKYGFRTRDSEKSVVKVGAVLAQTLAGRGYTTIHDGTIHDSPEYNGAYKRARETIKTILEQYPSIKVVLDVHRDAIEVIEEKDKDNKGDFRGSPVAAIAEIDGRKAAQVMIISPADDGQWDVPHFYDNLRLAAGIQANLDDSYPRFARPVLFDYCNYNLDLSVGSLLVEFGSHGNTLDEVLYAAQLFGTSLSDALDTLA